MIAHPLALTLLIAVPLVVLNWFSFISVRRTYRAGNLKCWWDVSPAAFTLFFLEVILIGLALLMLVIGWCVTGDWTLNW